MADQGIGEKSIDDGDASRSDAEIKRRQENIDDGKVVAFYEVCTNAFVNSAMELDKSLLTLAAGGIGFSLALISPIKESELLLFLYFLAMALFLATIFATLGALKANTYHIEGLVRGTPTSTGQLMVALDRIAIWSFATAVLLMTIVGACSVVEQRRSGKEMSEDSKKLVEIQKSVQRVENLSNESFQLLNRLDPGSGPLNASPTASPAPAQLPAAVPGTAGSVAPKLPGGK